jgi:hypothetical protein
MIAAKFVGSALLTVSHRSSQILFISELQPDYRTRVRPVQRME